MAESLVRILTGLNRDLEGLIRATAAMRPYFGPTAKDGKLSHLLIQLNKALAVQVRSAEEVRAVISQVFATGISNSNQALLARIALARASSGSAS